MTVIAGVATHGTNQVHGHEFTDFIKYAEWPDVKKIKDKRIEAQSVTAEVAALRDLLVRRIRAEYLPSDIDFHAGLTACTNLYDSDDYLLLRYSTSNAVVMQIQEGIGFYLMIADPLFEKVPLTNSQELVKTTAVKYLRFPGDPTVTSEHPDVFVSSASGQTSKCGMLYYGPKNVLPENWYSWIKWWTDGKRVLFALSKSDDVGGVAFRPHSITPCGPRRFGER